jgi:hypothetical protein
MMHEKVDLCNDACRRVRSYMGHYFYMWNNSSFSYHPPSETPAGV